MTNQRTNEPKAKTMITTMIGGRGVVPVAVPVTASPNPGPMSNQKRRLAAWLLADLCEQARPSWASRRARDVCVQAWLEIHAMRHDLPGSPWRMSGRNGASCGRPRAAR